MPGLALRWRVILWIAAAHLAVMAIGGATMLLNARDAVRLEIEAAQDSAAALARSLVTSLQSGDDFEALAARLAQPRHVRIRVLHPEHGLMEIADAETAAPKDEPAPDWFAAWVSPEIPPRRIPVEFGAATGMLEVEAAPYDEAAEVWEDVSGLFWIWSLATGALLVALVFLVGRALAPLRRIDEVLAALQAGRLSSRVGLSPNGDLAPLGDRIDDLAASLETAKREQTALAGRLMRLRDQQRKEIARDLHDELGPCLFAITVEAEALRKHAGAATLDRAERILGAVDRIRAVNRRVSDAMRPVTIGAFALADVIDDLVSDFEERAPQVTFNVQVARDLPTTNESVDLTVYRILQEGVTNALRHGAPTEISIAVRPTRSESGPGLEIVVTDDGYGLGQGWRAGDGLLGMQERIAALDGDFDFAPRSDGTAGALLRAHLPLERS